MSRLEWRLSSHGTSICGLAILYSGISFLMMASVGDIGTVVLESGPDAGDFLRGFAELAMSAYLTSERVVVLATPEGRLEIERAVAAEHPSFRVVGPNELTAALETPLVGFVPAGGRVTHTAWRMPRSERTVSAWMPELDPPRESAMAQSAPVSAWIAPKALACEMIAGRLAGSVPFWDRSDIEWISSPGSSVSAPRSTEGEIHLSRISRILAIIPHFACEPWLDQALRGLRAQTRPLDGIVVVDDCSPSPPAEIVGRYPEVTLLSSPRRAGPYQLIQEIFDSTSYDGYLLQDADDWSSIDRLELQLMEAERTGAELVGCQQFKIVAGRESFEAVSFPSDVNRALDQGPLHSLQHGTSLVARSLLDRSGGYSAGLGFGGDSEFLLRAHHLARIVNVPRFCYFRRIRGDSLTGSPSTGLGSPERKQLVQTLIERANANAERVKAGGAPLLTPLSPGERIAMRRVLGPELRCAGGRSSPP